MQLTMLKESFFILPSCKYGQFKRNFFCGTSNVEDNVEDVAFPVFGSNITAFLVWHTLFWSYNSRRLFQVSTQLKQKYVLVMIEYSSLRNSLALHLGSSFDQNGCPKNRENCSEILDLCTLRAESPSIFLDKSGTSAWEATRTHASDSFKILHSASRRFRPAAERRNLSNSVWKMQMVTCISNWLPKTVA